MILKSRLRNLAPRAIRAHRILSGPLRGRIIVTSLHDYPAAIAGRTEQPLLEWFRQHVKPGETWLDVGAHYGYTAIALAELVGASGHVYAFEPTLVTAGYLKHTRELNGLDQITVLPFGLGEPGPLRLTRTSIDRGMANHSLGGTDSDNMLVIGFDDFWATIGNGIIHGVKIDVQGMELQVLTGMVRTLSAHRPKLVLEFHAGVDRNRVIAVLSGAGYLLPAAPVEPLPSGNGPAYRDDSSYAFEPSSLG